ncbi:hypothetical protein [Robertmurraya siralis]|uniref:hypothetical protein n=1 Tax=Robertmurraya siralis TaxID=77777 RepID=UPI0010F55ABD|nr:hypothetical protein [Robertmurraya siralis]
MDDYVKFRKPLFLDGELVFETNQSYKVLSEDKENLYIQDPRGVKQGKYNWVSQLPKNATDIYCWV